MFNSNVATFCWKLIKLGTYKVAGQGEIDTANVAQPAATWPSYRWLPGRIVHRHDQRVGIAAAHVQHVLAAFGIVAEKKINNIIRQFKR